MPADGYAESPDELMARIRDERARVRKLKEWFRNSYEASQGWRERAVESYRFVSNQQWDDADLTRLRKERRPALVINKVLTPVLFLGGAQRQQRTEVKVLGFEQGDQRKAELMQALLKWVGAQSRETEVDSRVFLDKVITGLGFWKCRMDFSDSPEGMLRTERVSPLAIFTDPNWFDNGWKASKFVFHATWRDLDEAMEEWPEKADEIRSQYGEWISGEGRWSRGVSGSRASGEQAGDSFSTQRMFWDPELQRARVLECWYAETVKVPVAFNQATGEVSADEQHVIEMQMQGATVLTRPVRRIRVAHLLNDVLLDDGPSPNKEACFPIFPALGYQFWQDPFGIVEVMKDPQREINRRRSSIIEIVRRMPHAGFFNQESQGAKKEDLENYAKGAGAVIMHKGAQPVQITPPDLPQTLVYLERANAQEVREVVNINAELVGQGTQRTVSGRAIEARQRGGLTVQEPLLESFDHEMQDRVIFEIALIQQYVSIPKAVRILGSLAIQQPTDPNMPQLPGNVAELATLLSDAFSTKFDVLVKSQPYHPSVQAEKWDTLVELFQMFGPAIPPEVLVETAQAASLIDQATAQKILMQVQAQQQQQALQQQAAQQGLQAAAQGSPGPPPLLQ